tara:strand:+ start:278 stop:1585 length:1308 start_codon:yes stop_codon:yes gene_type:complete
MELLVFGLNHKTAPVGLRENWALSADESGLALERILSKIEGSEHLILSTCNRTEFYSAIPASSDLAVNLNEEEGSPFEELSNFYLGQDAHNQPPADDCFYLYRQENAVKHLFRVAGGLDSMIVGETEILRQLKEAYELSEKNRGAGKMFRHLFPEALKVGKKVRTSTTISEGCITPGQAALRLAMDILGDLDGKKALLIGSGTVAGLAARAFIENNLRKFTVMNRTTESAEAMLQGLKGLDLDADVLPLSADIVSTLSSTDVLISSTSSIEPLITKAQVEAAQQQRGSAPLVIIDLAVPRDIDPESGGLDGVHLFNIDDLNKVIQGNLAKRHDQFSRAEEIVRKQLDVFYGQLNYLNIDPVIRHLIERFEIIRTGELQNSMGDFPVELHETVDKLTRRLVNKLIHFPIERLKSIRDMQGLSEDEIAFLKKLFLPK